MVDEETRRTEDLPYRRRPGSRREVGAHLQSPRHSPVADRKEVGDESSQRARRRPRLRGDQDELGLTPVAGSGASPKSRGAPSAQAPPIPRTGRVIAPNLKRRLSGVTTPSSSLCLKRPGASASQRPAPALPASLPSLRWSAAARDISAPGGCDPSHLACRAQHRDDRRIVMRDILRMKLRLGSSPSAAQRHHKALSPMADPPRGMPSSRRAR